MKSYYRLMIGKKSIHADECLKGGFIGVDFGINEDLANKLHDSWRDFNKDYIPVFLKNHSDASKIKAGLACATVWIVAKGMLKGDIVLCPDGDGAYLIGEITEDYSYKPNEILFHRRGVRWYTQVIQRGDFQKMTVM